MDFDRLLELWEKFYYADLLMAFFEIAALVLAIIYVRKYPIGKLFIFYITFDFCILLIDFNLVLNPTISNRFLLLFLSLSNASVALVELLVYYYFFSQILKNRIIKKTLFIISLAYTLIVFVYLTTRFYFITNRYNYVSDLIGVMEFILLLPPCILYFLQLFKSISSTPLLKRPSFWIVTGIFFFSIISIPYYLSKNYILISYREYHYILSATLFNLPFTINFIFLSKAFLCKKPLTI